MLGWVLVIPVVVVAVVIMALVYLYRSELIMPGVQSLGLELGRHSTVEAAALMQQRWQEQQIVLDAGHTTWTVTPETLGLTLDATATAQLAHRQGRSLATLRELIKARGQVEIAPVWQIDPTLAEANLRKLAPQFDISPVEAGLRIVAGRAEATPAVTGRTLDVAATVARLAQNPAQIINDHRLSLVMVTTEPTLTDVSAPVAQANQLLANRLAISAYDPMTDETVQWTVEPDEWGRWLLLGVDPKDPTRLDWALDSTNTRTFLTEQSATLGPERYLNLDEAVTAVATAITTQNWPVRLPIYHHEQQHIVKPGETFSSIGYDYGIPYPWIQQANPTLADSLSPGQVLTIPSPDVLLPLPVVENKRIVVSLSQQTMWAYENGTIKWEWPVSTGITSSPTAPGVFQVQTHEPNAYAANWNLWMPHFMGIYRPVPTADFMNGFHGFPTRYGSHLLWTNDLGHPVTYGCILISSENAATLYNWAEAGVVVEVQK